METYDEIETKQDGIDLAKLIHSMCHLQDDDKQDDMVVAETN